MNWIKTDNKNKEAGENPCMIWIWDKDLRIGYCNVSLAYWVGFRWVDGDGFPITQHPDHSINAFIVLPKPKGRKLP